MGFASPLAAYSTGFIILQRLPLHPKETLGETKGNLLRELIKCRFLIPWTLRGGLSIHELLTVYFPTGCSHHSS